MKPVAWMLGASVCTWLALVIVWPDARLEVTLGLVAPLAAAVASWIEIARVRQTAPDRLTSRMLGAFAAKVLFFGVYVVVVLRVLDARPIPFGAAFAGCFVALHVIEAVFLRRLLMEDFRSR